MLQYNATFTLSVFKARGHCWTPRGGSLHRAPEIDAAMLKWAPRAAAGWCFQLLYLTLLRLLLSNKRDAEHMTGKERDYRGRHTFVAFLRFVVWVSSDNQVFILRSVIRERVRRRRLRRRPLAGCDAALRSVGGGCDEPHGLPSCESVCGGLPPGFFAPRRGGVAERGAPAPSRRNHSGAPGGTSPAGGVQAPHLDA